MTWCTLAAGDIVPADARLLESNHLYVDESAMTGESAPVAKAVEPTDGSPTPDTHARAGGGRAPADAAAGAAGRDHLVFFGTSVISGTGRAVVVATGPRTGLRRSSPGAWRSDPRATTSSAACAASGC